MASSVSVSLFAQARIAAGAAHLTTPLPPEGESLSGLLARLVREHPRLGPVLPHCRIARNGAFVRGGRVRLRGGDEIAIHPPYSGG